MGRAEWFPQIWAPLPFLGFAQYLLQRQLTFWYKAAKLKRKMPEGRAEKQGRIGNVFGLQQAGNLGLCCPGRDLCPSYLPSHQYSAARGAPLPFLPWQLGSDAGTCLSGIHATSRESSLTEQQVKGPEAHLPPFVWIEPYTLKSGIQHRHGQSSSDWMDRKCAFKRHRAYFHEGNLDNKGHETQSGKTKLWCKPRVQAKGCVCFLHVISFIFPPFLSQLKLCSFLTQGLHSALYYPSHLPVWISVCNNSSSLIDSPLEHEGDESALLWRYLLYMSSESHRAKNPRPCPFWHNP